MFQSPTHGEVDVADIKKIIASYMANYKDSQFRIIIGSDSQKTRAGSYDFVMALILHHVGSGGIYFWRREVVTTKMSLKERMYREAIMSLTSAEELSSLFRDNGIARYDVEIHVDIGRKGETKELINEITGMVRSSGYEVRIKPDSFGATKVADRHT